VVAEFWRTATDVVMAGNHFGYGPSGSGALQESEPDQPHGGAQLFHTACGFGFRTGRPIQCPRGRTISRAWVRRSSASMAATAPPSSRPGFLSGVMSCRPESATRPGTPRWAGCRQILRLGLGRAHR
jgi:hypothetical protein